MAIEAFGSFRIHTCIYLPPLLLLLLLFHFLSYPLNQNTVSTVPDIFFYSTSNFHIKAIHQTLLASSSPPPPAATAKSIVALQNAMPRKKKSILGRIEGDLASARAAIRKAVRSKNSTSHNFQEQSFIPRGSIYRNSYAFHQEQTKLIDLKQITSSEMERGSGNNGVAQWPFFVFLGRSMFCLLSSSICHLFSCHSHSTSIFLLRIDYVGITIMIITSFFPPIYYIFQCDSNWHYAYLGGITIMGLFTVVTLLSPKLSAGKFRGFRALLFSSMGLFGIVPAVHALIVNWSNPKRNIILVSLQEK